MAWELLEKEIGTVIFPALKNQREKLLETQMLASFDAFKGKYDSEVLDKWKKTEGSKWRSQVFVRLTKMKTLTGAATVEDIMLQAGKLPWDIQPTEEPMALMPGGIQLPKELIEKRCENMKRRIEDTIEETHATRPFINTIGEQALYGWSWGKFPVVKRYERVRFVPRVPETGMAIPEELMFKQMRFHPEIEEYWLPSFVHPSVWDVYWDLEDYDPQKGVAQIQRMDLSAGGLRSIVNEKPKLYNMAMVNEIIQKYKGASGSTDSRNPYLKELPERMRGIVFIEFYGKVEKDLLKKSGVEVDKEGKEVEIICAMAGAEDELKVIRPPKINRMPGQTRPLWISRWEHGMHEPAGIGIAENIKDAQQMVNSGVRLFVDNKALSGNLMLAGKSSSLAPGVNRSVMPGKWFELAEHITDVRQALQWFSPSDIGNGILDLINLFERFADEESSLPKILQGEMARHQPKTAFEMSKLMQSANKTLSKVIRNIDDEHIEPYIRSLYTYFMIADPDENIKGDYTCHATGFNSFMDKQVKGAAALNFLSYAMSQPLLALMTEIPDLYREVARSQDLERFIKSTEKIDEHANIIVEMMRQNAIANTMTGGVTPSAQPQQAGAMAQ